MEFTYPLQPPPLPKRLNPYIVYENKPIWQTHYDDIYHQFDYNIEHIQKNILQNHTLPIGTKIYHTNHLSLHENSYFSFGIDVVLALWMILDNPFLQDGKLSTLYECKVIKPIPARIVHKLYHSSDEVSIYPKIVRHGPNESPYDIGIEIRLYAPLYKDYIHVHQTYHLDHRILQRNAHKTLQEFNPIRAIVLVEMREFQSAEPIDNSI